MKCSECKHWFDDADNTVQGVGQCTKVKMLWDCSEWTGEYDDRIIAPKYSAELAFVQDGSDYRANLYTRPDFGCVQFEPKAGTALRYSMAAAALGCNETKHPQAVMAELGISYSSAEPRPLVDDWVFYGCHGIPKKLPCFLSIYNDLD